MLLHELIYFIISFTGRSITTFYQIYFNFLVALSFIRPYYFTLKLNIRNVRNACSVLHTLKERISIDLVFKAISINSIHLFFITILQGKLLSEFCGWINKLCRIRLSSSLHRFTMAFSLYTPLYIILIFLLWQTLITINVTYLKCHIKACLLCTEDSLWVQPIFIWYFIK